jgi:hypothetical protein
MSTKIYNAYKYTGSLDELMSDLQKIRQEYSFSKTFMIATKNHKCKILNTIDKGLYTDFLNKYKKYSLDNIEEDSVADKEINTLPCYVLEVFLENMSKTNYNHELNISASAAVYSHLGILYVQFFGYTPNIRKYKKFKDFHYQNQTDRAKSITKKEWEHREKVWNSIFNFSDIPSVCGLTYELGNDFFDISYEVAYMRSGSR